MKRALWALAKADVHASQVRVRWHFRHATVGSGAVVLGRPFVTCRDLTIGDQLLVFSQDRRIRLGGAGVASSSATACS